MKRYVGIVYDDREPERIMERFVSSVRNEVRSKIDSVLADFTDPDDGVRPSHLQYDIDEQQAVCLLLSKEELQLIIDSLNDVQHFEEPNRRTASILRAACKKLEREFSSPEDIVTIHCYGSVKQMERSKAIEEFTTAISCSEGSEQGRYCRILADLREGKKVASDGDPVPAV